jgi:small subunit ribosomal protein S21
VQIPIHAHRAVDATALEANETPTPGIQLLAPRDAGRKSASTAQKTVQSSRNRGQIYPKFNESSIIKEALWQVWRWDSLAEVRVQEGEPLENALRRFKRKVQQEDIIKEVKRHSYYLKPGEKKRVKAALARKRNRKKARKEQD